MTFRRKEDELALVKNTKRNMASLTYGEEQVGCEESKSEAATVIGNGSFAGAAA